jgi:hypothetical protein
MKVGDLVRHKGSLGMGIILGSEEPPYEEQGSYVRWFWDGGFVSLEFNEMLEALNESR